MRLSTAQSIFLIQRKLILTKIVGFENHKWKNYSFYAYTQGPRDKYLWTDVTDQKKSQAELNRLSLVKVPCSVLMRFLHDGKIN
jgi:hypothetical protein